jgi:uncharacterized iron-regulated protein
MTKLIVFLFSIFPLLANSQGIEKHYKIYNVKKRQLINIDAIVTDMAKADVLFFGEEHNDSIGHHLEVSLLQKLVESYPNKVALTMEMFHTDVQAIINEYLQGVISEKNFIKEARAWNNYKDYRPMVELAKAQRFEVIGGNAAARYSNAVTRNGLSVLADLPPTSKQFLPPLPIDTLTGRYYQKFLDLLGSHGMGPMKVYQSQNFWDATMAWSIAKFAKANKGHKIFQVNGRFHSDEGLGTYAQLKKMAPKMKMLNISCFSADDFNNPNWEKYQMLGDYVILTDPNVKRTF